MAIYTGNNGRIYIARRESSALSGTRTATVAAGQSVTVNQIFVAITVRGAGSGAQFRATQSKTAGQQCNFEVVSNESGNNYQSSDRIYLARYVGNQLVKVTNEFSAGTVIVRGVDTENEIVSDNYRIAKIRDWSYNSNSEVIETTALGDVTKTFAPSITSGDGSATLMFYEDDLNSAGTQKTRDIFELVDLLFPRDVPPRVIMNLAVDGGAFTVNDADVYKTNFLFNAYITSASVSVSYGEVVTVATNFTVDGPLIDVPWKPNVDRL